MESSCRVNFTTIRVTHEEGWGQGRSSSSENEIRLVQDGGAALGPGRDNGAWVYSFDR